MKPPPSDPTTGIFDPAADTNQPNDVPMDVASPAAPAPSSSPAGAAAKKTGRKNRDRLRFYRRSELTDAIIPENAFLVGDAHIFLGGISVLGGAPGVGKSRAAVALAVAGATCRPWFGLPVHRRFRSLILQSENGLLRLKAEFNDLPPEIENEVFISKDMTGFPFDSPEFRDELAAEIVRIKPDVVILDPWGDAVSDNMEKDYRAAFANIMSCLPDEEFCPALFIVAHTRKPRMGEQVSGRGLLNLLSGSQVLGSKPRAAFILQAATEEPTDEKVVFTCAKNNNGQLGSRSAWRRRNGLFEEVPDFDWSAFDGGNSGGHGNEIITPEIMAGIFENGTAFLTKNDAVARLMEATNCSKSTAYNAVNMKKSRFRDQLFMEPVEGKIGWRS